MEEELIKRIKEMMLAPAGIGNALVIGDRNSVSTAVSPQALNKALDELSEQRSLVANAQDQSERLIRIIDNLSRAKDAGQASQPARPTNEYHKDITNPCR